MQSLTQLVSLDLDSNDVGDIGVLSGFSGLVELKLSGNGISDISALTGLTELEWLFLGGNDVTDLGPLVGLTELWDLWLTNNANLTDIQPLIDNTGLGPREVGAGPDPGDVVRLWGTSVSCSDIALLEAEGVVVISDCP